MGIEGKSYHFLTMYDAHLTNEDHDIFLTYLMTLLVVHSPLPSFYLIGLDGRGVIIKYMRLHNLVVRSSMLQ